MANTNGSSMLGSTKAGIGVGAAVGLLALAAIVVWYFVFKQSQTTTLPRYRQKVRAQGTYETEI